MHFKDGFKFNDDGRRVSARDHRQFVSSNGHTIYTVTCWADRTFSCNCPGWAFGKARGKVGCKHCRLAEIGDGVSIAAPVKVSASFRPEPVKVPRRLIGDEN